MSADYGSATAHSRIPKVKSSIIISPRQLSVDGANADIKFPRIEDCAHFHYENVDYGHIKLSLLEESGDGLHINGSFVFEGFKPAFCVRVECKGKSWIVRRNLLHFEKLDTLLHECIYDRKFSKLQQLQEESLRSQPLEEIQETLRLYTTKLSDITDVYDSNSGGQISCGPVLHWLETDNHGRNLAPHALGDVADINIPAVAAARVVKRYNACNEDELSLDVGDMVSIIEMGATGWWRGKQGLRVGAFPAQCVRRINSATDVIATHERPFSPPLYHGTTSPGPIGKKHGKIMDFLRSFLASRPSKAQLKQKGILKERVFGCDLGELLHRTDEEVPSVVLDCTRFVEQHGIVDGIYRISGVASHIRFLRYEFDSDHRPDLERVVEGLPKTGHVPGMSKERSMVCDPHSIAGLCKLYFREMPNPLLTYQLYNRFASAVTDFEAEERLLKVHDAIQQLPPPHYRTLKHLITHLRYMANQDAHTSMHCRNLAIVWAPNLLRSREIEAGLAAFTEARVQSVVLEFMIVNGDMLFSDQLQTKQYDAEHKPLRPRSLMMYSTTKLISLEEAQARSRTRTYTTPSSSDSYSSSFHAENSSMEVSMRHPMSGSKSSNDRRRWLHKRGHSSTTSVCNTTKSHSANTRNPSQNQLVAIPLSSSVPAKCEAPLNTGKQPQNNGSGWKVKLGSLLKKTTTNTVQRQASLRRCQSEDSLVSQNKRGQASSTRRTLNFSRASLLPQNATKDCERGKPEPQVPHCSDQSIGSTKSRPLGGVYDDRKLTGKDVRKIIEESHNSDNVESSTSGKSQRDSTSPFGELHPDFPIIMGDVGLDFDPLSYKALSTERKSTKRQSRSPLDGEAAPSTPATSTTVSVRRVDSKQLLKGETIFAAVSNGPSRLNPTSLVAARRNGCDSYSERNNAAHPSVAGAHDPAARNGVSHRDVDRSIEGKNQLDQLTAANCTSPPKPATHDARRSLTRKKSAAELLGVVSASRGAVKHHRVPSIMPVASNNNNNLVRDSSDLPSLPVTSQSHVRFSESRTSPSVSVEYYSIPQNPGLQRNRHYGSFVALVGKMYDGTENEADNPSDYFRSNRYINDFVDSNKFRTSRSDQVGYLTSASATASTRSHSTLSPVEYDGEVSDRQSMGYSPNSHAQIFSPRLDTFDPAGRQRQDYFDGLTHQRTNKYTVPLSDCDQALKAPHCRSKSVDSYERQSRDSKQSFNRTFSSMGSHHGISPCPSEHGHPRYGESRSVYYPIPAPRKHYRSFSAGDPLNHQDSECGRKPVPLPRTSSRRDYKSPSNTARVSRDAPFTGRPHLVTNREAFRPQSYSNMTYDYVESYSHDERYYVKQQATQPNHHHSNQVPSSEISNSISLVTGCRSYDGRRLPQKPLIAPRHFGANHELATSNCAPVAGLSWV